MKAALANSDKRAKERPLECAGMYLGIKMMLGILASSGTAAAIPATFGQHAPDFQNSAKSAHCKWRLFDSKNISGKFRASLILFAFLN